MYKNKKILALFVLGSLIPTATAFATVTVPWDVRGVADQLHNEESQREIKDKAIANAKENAHKLLADIDKLGNPDPVKTAYEDGLRIKLKSMQDRVQKAGDKEQQNLWQVARMEKQRKDIEKQNDSLMAFVEENEGSSDAEEAYDQVLGNEEYYNELGTQIDALAAENTAIDNKVIALNKEIDALAGKMAKENINVSKEEAEKDRITQLLAAKRDLLDVDKNLKEYDANYNFKNRNSRSFATAAKYYTWKDSNGNKGRQFYMPFNYSVTRGAWEFGLDWGYIDSNNQNASYGDISGLTDTTLSAAYSLPVRKSKDMWLFQLGLNLPTGKDGLNGFDPVMDEDLVEKSRFGEGFNVTPGIWYYYNRDRKNTFIFGTYYNFGGSYYLNDNNSIEPGSAWVKEARWQYTDKKWQFLLGVSHTSYSETQESTSTYQSGNQFKPQIVVNYAPDAQQFFTVYYWYSLENPLREASFSVVSEKRNNANYGVQWAKELKANQRVRLFMDWLGHSGENYNPLTDISSDSRRKFTWGIGYDKFLNKEKTERLSFDLEKFSMHDGPYSASTVSQDYHGTAIYLRYWRPL